MCMLSVAFAFCCFAAHAEKGRKNARKFEKLSYVTLIAHARYCYVPQLRTNTESGNFAVMLILCMLVI